MRYSFEAECPYCGECALEMNVNENSLEDFTDVQEVKCDACGKTAEMTVDVSVFIDINAVKIAVKRKPKIAKIKSNQMKMEV